MRNLFAVLTVGLLLACVHPAWAQDSCQDSVFAVVEGNSVTVYHTGALYNCCPTRFDYDVDLVDEYILIVENEVLWNPCYCICCTDLTLDIDHVPPGEYTLEFHWLDYETGVWLVEILPVVVPGGVPDPGEPIVAGSSFSGCYGGSSDVEEQELTSTWGTIKALYR